MSRLISQLLTVMLCFALIAPHQSFAGKSADSAETQQPVIRDVELAEGGIARGVVVTSAGQMGVGVKVTLHSNDEMYEATTDENGRFAISGLRGGACVVKVGQTPYGARMWVNGTAPPKALKAFVVVDEQEPVIRSASKPWHQRFPRLRLPKGTGHLNPLSGLSHKQLIALGIGAAVAGATVAIIFAIEDDGDASN